MKIKPYQASNLKSTITFWPLFHSGSQFLAPMKNGHFLRFIHNNNNNYHFHHHPLLICVFSEYTEAVTTHLYQYMPFFLKFVLLSLILAVLRGLK